MSAEIHMMIGRLQGTVAAQRAEYMGHIMILHRKSTNGNGHGVGHLKQWASMGMIALACVIGLVKPDLAAALIRALLH